MNYLILMFSLPLGETLVVCTLYQTDSFSRTASIFASCQFAYSRVCIVPLRNINDSAFIFSYDQGVSTAKSKHSSHSKKYRSNPWILSIANLLYCVSVKIRRSSRLHDSQNFKSIIEFMLLVAQHCSAPICNSR